MSSRKKVLRKRVDKVMAAVAKRGRDFTTKQMQHLAALVAAPQQLYAKETERGREELSDYLSGCLYDSSVGHAEYGGHLMRLIDETCMIYILDPRSAKRFDCTLDEMVEFLKSALQLCQDVYMVLSEHCIAYQGLINRFSQAKHLPALYSACVAASWKSGEELKFKAFAEEFRGEYEAYARKKGTFAGKVKAVYGPLLQEVLGALPEPGLLDRAESPDAAFTF
ncbi:MAG: hypothetical protein QG604_757 [Candidatus Dependentiae bacterium]|nr:hypothetical protein [Candidatus Dependentiae bacterium]